MLVILVVLKNIQLRLRGQRENVFFRSSGVAGIGYFWANYLLQVKFMTKTGDPLVSYS